jgi:hypothetical protein
MSCLFTGTWGLGHENWDMSQSSTWELVSDLLCQNGRIETWLVGTFFWCLFKTWTWNWFLICSPKWHSGNMTCGNTFQCSRTWTGTWVNLEHERTSFLICSRKRTLEQFQVSCSNAPWHGTKTWVIPSFWFALPKSQSGGFDWWETCFDAQWHGLGTWGWDMRFT